MNDVLGPWVKIGLPVLLAEGHGKSLVQQQFLNPKTSTIHDFTFFGQSHGCIAFALTEDSEVIAVRQYKQGCDCITLELPAGTANSNKESPEETIRRELLEETGFEPKTIVSLNPSQFLATRSSSVRVHLFLATGCRKVRDPLFDPDEEIVVELFTVPAWIRCCEEEIFDSSTITATFKALRRLGYLHL